MVQIGSVRLDPPLVQAALSGYSDAPMRAMARRFGAVYALHQVVLDKSIAMSPAARRKLLPPLTADDHPVGGQLMGAVPEQFAEAAGLLAAHGFDVVDINFGCPVKKVLGRHRGGFLLSEPETAIEIMRLVRAAVPAAVPVSVKLRRGMDDSPESERNFFRILDAAFELGLAAATVHGRTVEQRYRGSSRWEFLACVKRHAGERVILGSGDLFTPEDVVQMLEQTGVDGVTIARGCIGNPWIFREAAALLRGDERPEPPSVAEQGCVIREHHALATVARGPLATRVMRKFGIKYAELHPQHKEVRLAFAQCRDMEDWLRVLERWYDPAQAWPPGRRKTAADHLVAAGATCEDDGDE